jgi:arylsulfatase
MNTLQRPNILLILPDQQRGDTLGYAGHPVVKTPNLDQLAAESVNFTQCYTNSPLCVPARASLQTGQYVCQHGAWNNRLPLTPESPSYVRAIRDAGYHTAVIGKSHLDRHHLPLLEYKRFPYTGKEIGVLNRWGFDHVHDMTGPMASVSLDSAYTDYLESKGMLKTYRQYQMEYLLRTYVKKLFGHIPAEFKPTMEQFDITIDENEKEPWIDPPWPLPEAEHYDSYTGRKAVDWLKGLERDKPFFLMVGFQGPHDPFDSPEAYRALYDPKTITPGIIESSTGPVPEYINRLKTLSGLDGLSPSHLQELMAAYYGKISHVDDWIGRLIAALKDKDLLDNTWIIYASDHGELLGDHWLCHKMAFYQGALHIPCLIRPPGGTHPRQVTGLADLLDLTATMLDIAGAPPMTGENAQSHRSMVIGETEGPCTPGGKSAVFSEIGGLSAVFDGRFKLVLEVKTRTPLELYDLEKDPRELHNAVADPETASVRQQLIDRLNEHLAANLNPERYQKFLDAGAGHVL